MHTSTTCIARTCTTCNHTHTHRSSCCFWLTDYFPIEVEGQFDMHRGILNNHSKHLINIFSLLMMHCQEKAKLDTRTHAHTHTRTHARTHARMHARTRLKWVLLATRCRRTRIITKPICWAYLYCSHGYRSGGAHERNLLTVFCGELCLISFTNSSLVSNSDVVAIPLQHNRVIRTDFNKLMMSLPSGACTFLHVFSRGP